MSLRCGFRPSDQHCLTLGLCYSPQQAFHMQTQAGSSQRGRYSGRRNGQAPDILELSKNTCGVGKASIRTSQPAGVTNRRSRRWRRRPIEIDRATVCRRSSRDIFDTSINTIIYRRLVRGCASIKGRCIFIARTCATARSKGRKVQLNLVNRPNDQRVCWCGWCRFSGRSGWLVNSVPW